MNFYYDPWKIWLHEGFILKRWCYWGIVIHFRNCTFRLIIMWVVTFSRILTWGDYWPLTNVNTFTKPHKEIWSHHTTWQLATAPVSLNAAVLLVNMACCFCNKPASASACIEPASAVSALNSTIESAGTVSALNSSIEPAGTAGSHLNLGSDQSLHCYCCCWVCCIDD